MSCGRPLRVSAGGAAGSWRVRAADVEWVAERLSERDWAIMETVNRLRLAHGDQLERLFFINLSGRSRVVTRGRVLRRLAGWHALQALPRRIGGAPRGSAGSVFAIDSVGQRLLARRLTSANGSGRVRRANAPTERTMRHTLSVSELYVGLVELTRTAGAGLAVFAAEPACWWPNGLGGYIKPDAYVVLTMGNVREHTWVEVDLATESLPTLKRKLLTYLDFVHRGQLGPHDVTPRVLVVVPGERRYEDVRLMLDRLPEPASKLFHVVTMEHAQAYLIQVLRE